MADSLFVMPVDFDPALDEVYNGRLWGKTINKSNTNRINMISHHEQSQIEG